MGVSHPPVSRRSVGNTSKQPYFHLSACRRSSRAGIQSAIQGEWVFTRRIEDCAKPKGTIRPRQRALGARFYAKAGAHPALRSSTPVQEARTFWPCSRNWPCGTWCAGSSRPAVTREPSLRAATTTERICADALVDAERRVEARTRFVWLRQFEPGSNSADAKPAAGPPRDPWDLHPAGEARGSALLLAADGGCGHPGRGDPARRQADEGAPSCRDV